MKTKADIPVLGIKTIFCSDSFAAYNRNTLLAAGNFQNVSFGEDTLMADKIIHMDYAVYYNKDACVYHSHYLTLREEFKRSIFIGRLHRQNHTVFDSYGRISGEGMRFVKSEMYMLISQNQIKLLPNALFHNFFKFLGYQLGKSGMY